MEAVKEKLSAKEMHIVKGMKRVEIDIYSLSGSKRLAYCKESFGQECKNKDGVVISSKSKNQITTRLREIAREYLSAEYEQCLLEQKKEEGVTEKPQAKREKRRSASQNFKFMGIARLVSLPTEEMMAAIGEPNVPEALVGTYAIIDAVNDEKSTVRLNYVSPNSPMKDLLHTVPMSCVKNSTIEIEYEFNVMMKKAQTFFEVMTNENIVSHGIFVIEKKETGVKHIAVLVTMLLSDGSVVVENGLTYGPEYFRIATEDEVTDKMNESLASVKEKPSHGVSEDDQMPEPLKLDRGSPQEDPVVIDKRGPLGNPSMLDEIKKSNEEYLDNMQLPTQEEMHDSGKTIITMPLEESATQAVTILYKSKYELQEKVEVLSGVCIDRNIFTSTSKLRKRARKALTNAGFDVVILTKN